MSAAKQIKIGELLLKLKAASPEALSDKHACRTLAEIVNAGKCELRVGSRRTGHSATAVEQMLSRLAPHEPIAYKESSDGEYRVIDLTEAELRLSDVQHGAIARGIELPAELASLRQSARRKGGRTPRPDAALIRKLFSLASSGLISPSLKAILKNVEQTPASTLRDVGIRKVVVTLSAMTITANNGRKYRKTRSSLKRYATEAIRAR